MFEVNFKISVQLLLRFYVIMKLLQHFLKINNFEQVFCTFLLWEKWREN